MHAYKLRAYSAVSPSSSVSHTHTLTHTRTRAHAHAHCLLPAPSQGLDSHRHSAAEFEEPARRRGLQLICIDRPGRGLSDPIPPPPEGADADAGGSAEDAARSQALMSEAIEAAVVDTVKQVTGGLCPGVVCT